MVAAGVVAADVVAAGACSGAASTALRGAADGAAAGGPAPAVRSLPASTRWPLVFPVSRTRLSGRRRRAAAVAPSLHRTGTARLWARKDRPMARTAPRAARWRGRPPATRSASSTPPHRGFPACQGPWPCSGRVDRPQAAAGVVRRSFRLPADATSLPDSSTKSWNNLPTESSPPATWQSPAARLAWVFSRA